MAMSWARTKKVPQLPTGSLASNPAHTFALKYSEAAAEVYKSELQTPEIAQKLSVGLRSENAPVRTVIALKKCHVVPSTELGEPTYSTYRCSLLGSTAAQLGTLRQ